MRPAASIVTRVLLAVLTVIIAFAIALFYNVTSQRRVIDELTRINQGYVPVTRQLEEVKSEIRSFLRVVSEDDPVVLRQSMRASMALFPFSARVDAMLAELAEHLEVLRASPGSQNESVLLANISGAVELLAVENREIGVLSEELLLGLDEQPPRLQPLHGELLTRLTALEKRLDDLGSLVQQRTDDAIAEVRRAGSRHLVRLGLASMTAILLAMVVVWRIRQSLQPILQLTNEAARLKEGDYRAPRIDAGEDEIGTLAREFSDMAEAIRDRDALLRQQRDALEVAYRELFEAQRAAVRAERLAAIGEISSRITHELRNPLSSIGLNVEMLREEMLDGDEPERFEMLTAIESEVARLTQLTESYLGMARGDTRRQEHVDLRELTSDIERQLGPEVRRAGAVLDVDLDAKLGVDGDPDQLRQVLINLLQNAIGVLAAVDGEPRIRVSAETEGQHIQLFVDDEGPGIDEAAIDGIFEPFVTHRDGGTGLGLSISRRIARAHDGDLTAEASGPLGGARFVLRLPLRRPED